MEDFINKIGVAPWIILTTIVTWIAAGWTAREKQRKEKEKTERERAEKGDRLEIHRDELMFEVLEHARQEMACARVEVEDLRSEVQKLRAMEQHFYHFQQSLDHLEALLLAETESARTAAERNAQAFLNRMRRLNEAKGTIANEAQHASAKVKLWGKEIDAAGDGVEDNG